jgi:hypothetical protein
VLILEGRYNIAKVFCDTIEPEAAEQIVRDSMRGIYSSTVNASTLDEAAFAYKPMEEILNHITGTVDVVERIKPVYNFKAAE